MKEMWKKSLMCGLVLLAAAGVAWTQQAKPANKSYVLKAERMFDGKSDTLITPGLWW